MLHGKMSPWQYSAVKNYSTNIPMKFGNKDQISKSWDSGPQTLRPSDGRSASQLVPGNDSTTLWLHLEWWNLLDFQLCWESKMEPRVLILDLPELRYSKAIGNESPCPATGDLLPVSFACYRRLLPFILVSLAWYFQLKQQFSSLSLCMMFSGKFH